MKRRIPKSDARQIKDLKDHLDNLQDAQKRFSEGGQAAYKDILTNLRTLLGKGAKGHYAGLLLRIMAKYDIQVTSETIGGDTITFQQFLASTQVLNARTLTHLEFVWELASQDAAHADEGLDPAFVMAEQISVGGVPTNIRILDGITGWTLGVGRIVIAKFRLADGSVF